MQAEILHLPERLTLATVAALHREHVPNAASIAAFDVSAVREWDSAGVALIQALRTEQRRRDASPAPVIGDGGRFAALCRAHRITDPGSTA